LRFRDFSLLLINEDISIPFPMGFGKEGKEKKENAGITISLPKLGFGKEGKGEERKCSHYHFPSQTGVWEGKEYLI
jgi:hypothetical protein